MTYLLSKKLNRIRVFLLSIVLVGIALGVVFFLNNNGDLKNQYPALFFAPNNSQIGQQYERLYETSKDSDEDGLKNWEEALWKTDPQNPDTDGDGTNDNEEILAKRNPLKAGPDDEVPDFIEQMTATNKDTDNNSGIQENLTAVLAEDFATTYFRQKFLDSNSGQSIDESFLTDQLFTDITETISEEGSLSTQKYFSTKDFITMPSTAPNDMRQYINKLGNILLNGPSLENHEVDIMNKALAEENLGLLQELDQHRAMYQSLASAIQKLPVPKPLAGAHSDMANSFWQLSLVIEKVMQFEKDPVKGVAALRAYTLESQHSLESLQAIVSAIKAHEFTFSAQEGGAVFNSYLSQL